MNKKGILNFVLVISVLCFSQKPVFCAEAVAISSQFPLIASGKSHNYVNQTLYFCQNYLSFLQTEWKIKPDKITPIRIRLDQKKNRFTYEPGVIAQIFIKPDDRFAKLKLAHVLTEFFIKDYLTFNKKITKKIKIPKFITHGLSAIYFNTKIEPEFLSVHNKIADNEYIPLDLLVSIDKILSPAMNKLFILESVYLLEYIKDSAFGEIKIHKFLIEYQKGADLGLVYLAQSMRFQSINELEANFLSKISAKNIIYNTASLDSEVAGDKNIPIIVEEILIFSYPDPSYKDNGIKINISAFDLKIEDLPYISKSQIREKIIRLELIKGFYPDKNKIDNYILAFKSLEEGNFEKYFDFLYLAGKQP